MGRQPRTAEAGEHQTQLPPGGEATGLFQVGRQPDNQTTRHSMITDYMHHLYSAEAGFNHVAPPGTPVLLLPTEGTTEGTIRTRTAGAAFIEGRSVMVLTEASALPVNINRVKVEGGRA